MNGNTFTMINGVKHGSYDIAVEMAEIMVRQENSVIEEEDIAEWKRMESERRAYDFDFKWDEEELLKELNPSPSEKKVLEVELLYLRLNERFFKKAALPGKSDHRVRNSKRPKDNLPFSVFKAMLDEAIEISEKEGTSIKTNDDDYVQELVNEGYSNEEIEIKRKKREMHLIKPKLDKFNKRFLPVNAGKSIEKNQTGSQSDSFVLGNFEKSRQKAERAREGERNRMINNLIKMKQEDDLTNERIENFLKESKKKRETRKLAASEDMKSAFLRKLEEISKMKETKRKQNETNGHNTNNSSITNSFFLTNIGQIDKNTSFASTGLKRKIGIEEGSTFVPSTLRNGMRMTSLNDEGFEKSNEANEVSMRPDETMINNSLVGKPTEREKDDSLKGTLLFPKLLLPEKSSRTRALSTSRPENHLKVIEEKGKAKRRAISQEETSNRLLAEKNQGKMAMFYEKQRKAVVDIADQINKVIVKSQKEFLNEQNIKKHREVKKELENLQLHQHILANAWGSLPEKKVVETAHRKIKETTEQTQKDVERFKNEQKITEIYNLSNKKRKKKFIDPLNKLRVFKRKLFLKVDKEVNG